MPNLISQLVLPVCPHCGVNTPNLDIKHGLETRGVVDQNRRFWRVYACKRCGGIVTAAAEKYDGPVTEMFPSSVEVDESIPERARDYLVEAIASVHAPSGAIMLSASAVDAMLKEKGYTTGNLNSRIHEAVKDHLITEEMAKWAHEIRLDANDERHADETATKPTDQDAKRCIDFALALAEFLFVLPARIKRGLLKATT